MRSVTVATLRDRPTRLGASPRAPRSRASRPLTRRSSDRRVLSLVAVRIVAIEGEARRLVVHGDRAARARVALASASRRSRVRVSARVAPRVALRRRRRRRHRGVARRGGARLERLVLFVGFHEHAGRGWMSRRRSSSRCDRFGDARAIRSRRSFGRVGRARVARRALVARSIASTRRRRRAPRARRVGRRRRPLRTRTRASVRVCASVLKSTSRGVAASTDGARAATHSRARRTRRTRRANDARSRCREGEPRTARAREDGEG